MNETKGYSRGCGYGNAKLRINRYAKEMFALAAMLATFLLPALLPGKEEVMIAFISIP
jgi:hypothetical protein